MSYLSSSGEKDLLSKASTQRDEEVLEASILKPELFSGIVDKYKAPFLKKAKKILGSEEPAEDAVQETFVKIYVKAGKFQPVPGATFQSWAYKILINTCFSMYKKSSRERVNVVRETEEVMNNMSGGVSDFERKIDIDYFMSVVSKLPAVMERVLKYVVIGGKTPKEIAEAERLSVGAVRTRIHRAKKAFNKVSADMV